MTERDTTNQALAAERAAIDSELTNLRGQLALSQAALSEERAADVIEDAAYEARIRELEAQLPQPERPSMRIAAAYNVPGTGGHDPDQMERQMGLTDVQQLDYFRVYEQGNPPDAWSKINHNEHVGKRPLWISFPCNLDQLASGALDANLRKLAQTYDPLWPELRWTFNHEVEPKLDAQKYTFEQFKAGVSHGYEVLKAAAPDNWAITVIHGRWGWREGSPTTTQHGTYSATPAEWLTIPSDGQGLDCYGSPSASDIVDLEGYKRFKREMCGGDASLIHLGETGVRQSEVTVAECVAWVRRNADRCAEQGVATFSYWNSSATENPGPLPLEGVAAYGDAWREWSPERPAA